MLYGVSKIILLCTAKIVTTPQVGSLTDAFITTTVPLGIYNESVSTRILCMKLSNRCGPAINSESVFFCCLKNYLKLIS